MATDPVNISIMDNFKKNKHLLDIYNLFYSLRRTNAHKSVNYASIG